jgi:hypothetical protein
MAHTKTSTRLNIAVCTASHIAPLMADFIVTTWYCSVGILALALNHIYINETKILFHTVKTYLEASYIKVQNMSLFRLPPDMMSANTKRDATTLMVILQDMVTTLNRSLLLLHVFIGQ